MTWEATFAHKIIVCIYIYTNIAIYIYIYRYPIFCEIHPSPAAPAWWLGRRCGIFQPRSWADPAQSLQPTPGHSDCHCSAMHSARRRPDRCSERYLKRGDAERWWMMVKGKWPSQLCSLKLYQNIPKIPKSSNPNTGASRTSSKWSSSAGTDSACVAMWRSGEVMRSTGASHQLVRQFERL